MSVLERCPCLAEKRVMLFKSKRRPLLEQNTKEIMEEILESPNYTSSNRRLCEKTVILQTNSTETIIKTQQNRFLHTDEPPLTATSLQRPFFWRTVHTFTLVNNLSTTATLLCPLGRRCREVQL